MLSVIRFAIFGGIIGLSLAGCGDGGSTSKTPVTSAKLTTTSSEQQFVTHIRNTLLKRYGAVSQAVYYPSASATDSASGAISTNSTTNTQEAGVDEEDRLKTDGQYLYATSVETPSLLVFKPDAATAPQVANLTFATQNNALLSGLYLHNKTAIAVAKDRAYGWGGWLTPAVDMMFAPMNMTAPTSQLFFVDISQPESPKQRAALTIDGQLISSRLVGSTLYLSLRYTPTLKDLTPNPTTEAQANANRNLINNASLQDLMPNYKLGNTTAELFNSRCLQTLYSADSSSNTIIEVLAIDITTPNPTPKGLCFMGDAETLYASPDAIYLATTQYTYPATTGAVVAYDGIVQTDIHKFALKDGAISYKASGRVGGHLGWYQDLKPFRLSEYNNVLRVITFTGDQPSTLASTAKLYNLKENAATQTLEVIGTLPNNQNPQSLGKAGEQIYATRFAGDRGYLVTYQLTDPLYILDLADPVNPKMLSALEINGYSDYLHPVGKNYLLGIGKDAVVTENGTGDNNRSAWYQGVKLSLIDLTNPAQPFEKDKIIIGKRGSNTAVSQTHHALTSLQIGNHLQVAVPVSVNETPAENDVITPESSRYYNWTRDELVRLTIDAETGTINQLPALISQVAGSESYSKDWSTDRSVIMGSYIHYLHNDKVISSQW